MISKSLALKVLNEALATGGDYAEIYLEQNDSQSVMLENGKVETNGSRRTYGAGIRILKELKSVYGYTSVLTAKSLIELAHNLSASFTGSRQITVEKITKQKVQINNPIEDHLTDVPLADKIALLKECYSITSAVDKRIVRVQNGFSNNAKKIEIFSAESSEGKQFENVEERGRLILIAVAAENDKIETYFEGLALVQGRLGL
jgi:TldD protein